MGIRVSGFKDLRAVFQHKIVYMHAGIGDVRLQARPCEGNFEIYGSRQTYNDLCDRNFGVEEAQVVCRQLGCNPVGARKTTAK